MYNLNRVSSVQILRDEELHQGALNLIQQCFLQIDTRFHGHVNCVLKVCSESIAAQRQDWISSTKPNSGDQNLPVLKDTLLMIATENLISYCKSFQDITELWSNKKRPVLPCVNVTTRWKKTRHYMRLMLLLFSGRAVFHLQLC